MSWDEDLSSVGTVPGGVTIVTTRYYVTEHLSRANIVQSRGVAMNCPERWPCMYSDTSLYSVNLDRSYTGIELRFLYHFTGEARVRYLYTDISAEGGSTHNAADTFESLRKVDFLLSYLCNGLPPDIPQRGCWDSMAAKAHVLRFPAICRFLEKQAFLLLVKDREPIQAARLGRAKVISELTFPYRVCDSFPCHRERLSSRLSSQDVVLTGGINESNTILLIMVPS